VLRRVKKIESKMSVIAEFSDHHGILPLAKKISPWMTNCHVDGVLGGMLREQSPGERLNPRFRLFEYSALFDNRNDLKKLNAIKLKRSLFVIGTNSKS
jgi:hypothetical protein